MNRRSLLKFFGLAPVAAAAARLPALPAVASESIWYAPSIPSTGTITVPFCISAEEAKGLAWEQFYREFRKPSVTDDRVRDHSAILKQT